MSDSHRTLAAARRDLREAHALLDLATSRRQFLTVRQLADCLDCDPRTIRRMIDSQALPAARVGRTWRIPTEAACRLFHVERHLAAS